MLLKSFFRRSLTCIITIVLCFVCVGSYANIKTYAFDYTHGVMFNQYYRIKNVASNLYLTMNFTTDADGIMCTLQSKIANNPRQIFYLNIDYYANTYYFIPNTTSTNRVLSVTTSSDVNNNSVVLATHNSDSREKWRIVRTSNGFAFYTHSGTKAMAPMSLGTASGTRIGTWDYTAGYCDWVLEPAYSGHASYFAITTLSSEDSASADNVVNDMRDMGYTHERVDLPLVGQLAETMAANRITIIHGHGNVGFIRLDQTDGTSVDVYSENATNCLSRTTRRNSYVVFITCYSAATSTERTGMVQAAYAQGAACVTGFRNTVARGEEYIEDVMDYLEKNPEESIEDAMDYADENFSCNQCSEANCPANTQNRLTMGLKNASINMN